MKTPLAIALAASLCACGGASSTSMDQRTRDAMPTSDTVAMNTPDASANNSRGAKSTSGVGDVSVLLGDTVQLGVAINTGVIHTLDLIQSITDLPVTSCTTDSCTWGPGALALDPVSWELVVTYDATSGAFDYTLSGQAKSGGDGEMHAVITGSATPSGTPHRGTGNFNVDFDEAKVLNPANTDIGKLEVTYSNAVVGAATIGATFLGVNDDDHAGQQDNAAYAYAEDGHGGGSLQAASRNLTSGDLFGIDSRWVASGAGRSDVGVTFTDTQGSVVSATESECWASATSTNPAPFRVVYFESSDATDLGPDAGEASNCAFPTAQATTLSAP